MCASCHHFLDPLGLPFEHYDGIGRWRDDDRGMALDVSGELDDKTFNGVPEMAQMLSEMPDVRACYVAEWLRFSQGKLNSDLDRPYVDWLMTRFTRNTRVTDLVAAIVASDTLPVPQTCAHEAPRGDDKKMQASKPERRIPRTLSRRALLKGALGVGVALPWLELMRPRGLRASAGRPRAQAVRRLLQPVRHHPRELAPDAAVHGAGNRLHAVADPVAAARRSRTTSSCCAA